LNEPQKTSPYYGRLLRYRLRHIKKGNGFPTIAESLVSTSTSGVSKPHILLIFKRMVFHYCILPRETTELGSNGCSVGKMIILLEAYLNLLLKP